MDFLLLILCWKMFGDMFTSQSAQNKRKSSNRKQKTVKTVKTESEYAQFSAAFPSMQNTVFHLKTILNTAPACSLDTLS